MRTYKASLFATVATTAVVAALCAPQALAQSFNDTVHGHVTNVLGQTFVNGDVKFSKDKDKQFKDEKFLNTVAIDADGNYTAKDIAPGDYNVWVVQGEKPIDHMDLTVKAGDDKTLDFDMTRAEYLKAMTPEEKKALEEYKAKSSAIMESNKVIVNLNATLKTVRADLATALPTKGDVNKDVDDMKKAVDSKPDSGVLWLTYGDALQAQGDHLAAEDRKLNKTPLSDDAVTKAYGDAEDAYTKSQALDAASAKPDVKTQAVQYNQMGNVLSKLGKIPEATVAFDNAAKADPSGAGRSYKNEAVVFFNANQTDAALTAAEKAIAADPTIADAYYIKGQALVTKVTADPKTNKLIAPPGCVEAYQKFLELAPDSPNAPSVREVLASLGEKVDKTYKTPKK
jgi:tetratricopeptide (TPR) repeat protein